MEFGCLWRLIPCSTPSTRSCRRCKPWFAQDTWLQLVWLQENWMKDKLNWDLNVMLRSVEHRSHWVAGKLTWDHKVATMAANTSPSPYNRARKARLIPCNDLAVRCEDHEICTASVSKLFEVSMPFGRLGLLVQKSSKISNLPGAQLHGERIKANCKDRDSPADQFCV